MASCRWIQTAAVGAPIVLLRLLLRLLQLLVLVMWVWRPLAVGLRRPLGLRRWYVAGRPHVSSPRPLLRSRSPRRRPHHSAWPGPGLGGSPRFGKLPSVPFQRLLLACVRTSLWCPRLPLLLLLLLRVVMNVLGRCLLHVLQVVWVVQVRLLLLRLLLRLLLWLLLRLLLWLLLWLVFALQLLQVSRVLLLVPVTWLLLPLLLRGLLVIV